MCSEDMGLSPVNHTYQELDLHLPFLSVDQYEVKAIFLLLKLSSSNDPCLVLTLLFEHSDNFYNSYENTSFLLLNNK